MTYADIQLFQTYTGVNFGPGTSPSLSELQTILDMSKDEVDIFTGKQWNTSTHTDIIYKPLRGLNLLKIRPVQSVQSVKDENGDDVPFEVREDDFIYFTQSLPSQAKVEYTSGYTTIPTVIKKLQILYTLRSIKQGESYSQSSSSNISLGPISITNLIGVSTMINLDKDIREYENKVRRLMR